MEKQNGGYFISLDELQSTAKIIGYVGLGLMAAGVMRSLIWGPPVRIVHE